MSTRYGLYTLVYFLRLLNESHDFTFVYVIPGNKLAATHDITYHSDKVDLSLR